MQSMNILYWIDEWKKDYSRYLWISILSLLEHNKDEDVHIYILSNYIDESNKQELIRIVKSYWKEISFSEWKIIPEKYMSVLSLKWEWRRPMATYYRFFFLDKFDIKDRVLYLDCDTIINKNLSEFYYTNFNDNSIIWAADSPIWVYINTRKYWLSKYINAWVLLIDINAFKKADIYNWIVSINKKYGIPEYNDQDYINIIFQDKIKTYENLQCMISYKRVNYKIDNYLILHTVSKPNMWWYSLCPKKIEKLFDNYLSKTKWRNYIWWERAWNLQTFLWYAIDYTRNFIVYFSMRYIWPWFASKIHNLLNTAIVKILKIWKKIRLLK